MVDTIVIARHEEDISWAKDLNTFVIQKGEHMDNWGREPSSFLWYIIEHYDVLKGSYMFVQGNPFDHCRNLLDFVDMQPEFMSLGDHQHICKGDGNPQHGGLPLEEMYKEFVDAKAPDMYGFKAGGQFIVSAKRIKQLPKEYYQNLLDYVKKVKLAPWCMERLWGYIFKKEK